MLMEFLTGFLSGVIYQKDVKGRVAMARHKKIERIKEIERRRKRRSERLKMRAKAQKLARG